MKLLAPLSFIKTKVQVLFVKYGYYKIIVYDNVHDIMLVSLTSNTSAYDRIVFNSCISDYRRGCGNYTLRQAYLVVLSISQISLLNTLYYETKSTSRN